MSNALHSPRRRKFHSRDPDSPTAGSRSPLGEPISPVGTRARRDSWGATSPPPVGTRARRDSWGSAPPPLAKAAEETGEPAKDARQLHRRVSFSYKGDASERGDDDQTVRKLTRAQSQPATRAQSQPAQSHTLKDLVNTGTAADHGQVETSEHQAVQLRSPSPIPESRFDNELRERLSQLASHRALHPNMEALLARPHTEEIPTPELPLRRAESMPMSVQRRFDSTFSTSSRDRGPLSPKRPDPLSPKLLDPQSPRRSGVRSPSWQDADDVHRLPCHQDIGDDSQSEHTQQTPAGSTTNSRRPSRILDASELAIAVDANSVLKREFERSATQVVSCAYTDEDNSGEATSSLHFKRDLVSALDPLGLKPGQTQMRTLNSLRKALEMGQLTILVTWLSSAAICVIIALQCAGLLVLSGALQNYRLRVVEVVISDWSSEFLAFLLLLIYALLCTAGTAYFVSDAPRAQGSGIPDLKAFLNGNHIPQLFSFRTWAVRGIGLVLVTSAGLSAGTEGPCAHLGAIASKGLARSVFRIFRDSLPAFGHRTNCEFVAMGTAVGVAAAFSAPVGGILFAMEEASSFWSKGLTVRSFVGSMLAAAIVKSAKTGFRELPSSGFIEFPDPTAGFEMRDLVPFFFIGIGTSFLGVLFCTLVERLTRLRWQFYAPCGPRLKRLYQVLEVLAVTFFTITICFWVPLMFGCMKSVPKVHVSNWYVGKQTRTVCRADHYSDIGTMLLERRETAIKALFTHSFEDDADFRIFHLFLCATIVFVLTLLTYGTALPMGLFVPNIMVGACFGRGIGQIWASFGFQTHLGVHALVGAAGMLAGFSRAAVSLTMIMAEITNSTKLLLPIMLCILISKTVADRFTESTYDISINLHSLQDISIIKGDLDDEDMPVLKALTVHDACSVEIQTLKCEEMPAQIMSTLAQTKFTGFPLVTDPEHKVVGIIQRKQLVEALQSSDVFFAQPSDVAGHEPIKLLQYADTAPEVMHWNMPLARGHRHFIAAGLRHLCLVDETHKLVGILTRSDLAPLSHPGTRRKALTGLLTRKQSTLLDGAAQGSHGTPSFPWQLSRQKSQTSSQESSDTESDTSEITTISLSIPNVRSRGPKWSVYQ